MKKGKDAKIEAVKSDENKEFKICLVRCKHFSDSRPGDDWFQCLTCKHKPHELYISGEDIFICQNCDSDNDLD